MSGMFCVVTGIVLAMFGVGGIEQSLDNDGLIAGALVSSLGLMIMACGVMMLEQEEQNA